MTDTQLRFLRAIFERLPAERIVEAYVFPPMKQGGQETGIAILAARRELPPAAVDALLDAPACDPTEGASRGGDSEGEDSTSGTAHVSNLEPPPSPSGSENPGFVEPDVSNVESPPSSSPAPSTERHTVYTARYRLTLKGPERGKWEVDVVEEADAPLLTVEVVVRGVQRRSGEEVEPERLLGDALHELAAPRDAA